MASVEEQCAAHRARKAELMKEEEKLHFSYDLEESLTAEERSANEKLQKVKEDLVTPMSNVLIHNFYQEKPRVEASRLHKLLDAMPKGAIHHMHTTASPPVSSYMELTYEPIVYYNERESLFKVFPQHHKEDGYVSCVEMRNFYKDPKEYDDQLRSAILLTEDQIVGKESHQIWKNFQHKFSKVNDLSKYHKFFKKIFRDSLDACIAQNVFVVELRHISGMLFDDQRKSMGVLDELALIQEVLDEVKKETPYFELRLILTGLKMVGEPHVNKILDHLRVGKEKYPELITGFDLVNEEEYFAGIQEFMPTILGAQQDKDCKETYGMDCFFHAGETCESNITNLHDAVLLNTKRIGHGFQLFLFPNLVQEVIKRDICVEVCPLSNMVLGYTLDLRSHPIRALIHQGLQVSISPDDPCYFNYKGVTLDYTYVTLAWELDIRDLKKLSLNGIRYSSISDKHKEHLENEVFPKKWAEFITFVNNIDKEDGADNGPAAEEEGADNGPVGE